MSNKPRTHHGLCDVVFGESCNCSMQKSRVHHGSCAVAFNKPCDCPMTYEQLQDAREEIERLNEQVTSLQSAGTDEVERRRTAQREAEHWKYQATIFAREACDRDGHTLSAYRELLTEIKIQHINRQIDLSIELNAWVENLLRTGRK